MKRRALVRMHIFVSVLQASPLDSHAKRRPLTSLAVLSGVRQINGAYVSCPACQPDLAAYTFGQPGTSPRGLSGYPMAEYAELLAGYTARTHTLSLRRGRGFVGPLIDSLWR